MATGTIKGDRLIPSDRDLVELSNAVQERFISVFEYHQLTRKAPLVHPRRLESDLIAWREMVVRHRKGDFRHTRSEQLSLRAIAQWTFDVNAELRNQPKKDLVWKD